MKQFDNIPRKELIIALLPVFYILGWTLSFQELFYYRVSEVLFSLEALFFVLYVYQDVKKFSIYPKICYATILSACILDVFSAFRICSIKFSNPNKTAYDIDVILANDYTNYITQYSKPFIIFTVIILVILVLKFKRPKDE